MSSNMLLNESDVKELFINGEIPVAHAVECISSHLKKICDDEDLVSTELSFSPKNIIEDLCKITDMEELTLTLEMEDMVLDEIRKIAKKLIDGCLERQTKIQKQINVLNEIINERDEV